jgi:hypothetical protein
MPIALTLCATALCAAFTACNMDSDNSGTFASVLRGTWTTNLPEAYDYSGTLVISRDTITITGYESNYWNPDDPQRPFKDITKGVARSGYSEDGKIYIDDFGLKEFAYEYDSGVSPAYTKLLRFNFDGRNETLIKSDEAY